MAKVIEIVISDRITGTDVRCSLPWSELKRKYAMGELAPGAEEMAYTALMAITESVARRKANLLVPKAKEYKL